MSIEAVHTIDGISFTVREIAEKYNLCVNTVRGRMRDKPGITFAELTAPPKPTSSHFQVKVTINGEEKSLRDWAKEYHISFDTIYARYKAGKSGEDLLRKANYKSHAIHGTKPVLSKENIRWLLDTRGARRGQLDEWEIACELIGADPSYSEWLRKEFEERGLA